MIHDRHNPEYIRQYFEFRGLFYDLKNYITYLSLNLFNFTASVININKIAVLTQTFSNNGPLLMAIHQSSISRVLIQNENEIVPKNTFQTSYFCQLFQ